MRWGIIGARVSIILVELLIAAIIIMSVLPLVNGGLRVDIPDGMQEPTLDGNMVRFAVPVDVYNGGYFDISGFQMMFRISNEGQVIAEDSSEATTIPTGKTTRVNVVMEMDLDDVPAAELKKLVFERSTLDLTVGVEASYTMGLVSAAIHTDQTMEWEPLIRDIVVNTAGMQIALNGTQYELVVPYSFSASDMVTGNTVDLAATLRNSTSQISSTSQSIVLQGYNAGQLRFLIDQQAALWLMTHSEDLVIGADLSYGDATFHQDYNYHWEGVQ